MAVYKRLMEAESSLEDVRRRRGVSDTALGDALEATESEPSRIEAEGLYLPTLLRYVSALGGRLEVRAVFGEEAITLFRHPEPPAGA